jgi:hypothetical protein
VKPELENGLIEKYPEIFTRENEYGEREVIGYGISVGDGWYSIIDSLCSTIQSHLNHHRSKGHLTPAEFEEQVQTKAAQVKEKFGGLRFYVDNSDIYVRGAIQMAESMSVRTCETCGSPGKQRKGGWVKTLCQPCEGKRK